MKKKSEEFIQGYCYLWFHNNYCLKNHKPRLVMFSVPGELAMKMRYLMIKAGLSAKKANEIVAMCLQSMKNTGFLPGVSDTVIMGDNGKVYWVEFKLPNNNQQANQIEFEQRCKDLGHEYVVIKSLEQFKEYVQSIIISK